MNIKITPSETALDEILKFFFVIEPFLADLVCIGSKIMDSLIAPTAVSLLIGCHLGQFATEKYFPRHQISIRNIWVEERIQELSFHYRWYSEICSV
jgi:hypothetical protein